MLIDLLICKSLHASARRTRSLPSTCSDALFAFPLFAWVVGIHPVEAEYHGQDMCPAGGRPTGFWAPRKALALSCSHDVDQALVGCTPHQWWAQVGCYGSVPHSIGPGLIPSFHPETDAQTYEPGKFNSTKGASSPELWGPSGLTPLHNCLQRSGSAPGPQDREEAVARQ